MASSNPDRCGATLSLRGISKQFDARPVLSNISLEVQAGEFVAIVGRSGSGKSTLLRVLCGLEEPTAGTLRVLDAGGKDAQSGVRVVFQEPRLLPWKSLLANVSLGIVAKGDAKKRALAASAHRVLEAVGLGERADEYPSVLSGGQRQRVALARALLHEPSVMLLDEPFGALDALTRIEAQRLVESLWLERGFTALLVTHDVSEAVLLADRVLLIEDGAIAASFDVALPRPRQRGDAEPTHIASQVLDRIFASPEAGRTLRPPKEPVSGLPQVSKARAKPAHA